MMKAVHISLSQDPMWTGLEWFASLSGTCLLTSIIICIAIFLTYVWKNQEHLSLRILNILFVKLAVANFFKAIFVFGMLMWVQSDLVLTVSLKVFTQQIGRAHV